MDAALESECLAARELVSLSLDGELNALEGRKLDRHLRVCVPCQLHGVRVEAITRALRSAPLERPPIFIPPFFSRRRRLRMRVSAAAPVATVSGVPHQAR